jgi:hypothetical protein
LLAEAKRILRICEILPRGNPLQKTRTFVTQLGAFAFSHESLAYITREKEARTLVDLQGTVTEKARLAEEVARQEGQAEPWSVDISDRLLPKSLGRLKRFLSS